MKKGISIWSFGGSTPEEAFAAAKQYGFDGWLCIEECSGQGLAGVAQAYRFVRDAWDQA